MKTLPKRIAKWLALLLCGVSGLVALTSYLFREDWDGAFPPGEYRVIVQDDKGQPIPNATLRPYFADGGTSTDAQGRVVFTQFYRGLQFGGTRWKLFWLIRMGDQPPEYIWEVSAEGFRTFRFGWPEYSAAQKSKTEPTVRLPHPDRKEMVELPVYDVVVTLKR